MKTDHYQKIKLQLTKAEFLYFCSQTDVFALKRRLALIYLTIGMTGSGGGLYLVFNHCPWFPLKQYVFVLLWLLFGTIAIVSYSLIHTLYQQRFLELIDAFAPNQLINEGEEDKKWL